MGLQSTTATLRASVANLRLGHSSALMTPNLPHPDDFTMLLCTEFVTNTRNTWHSGCGPRDSQAGLSSLSSPCTPPGERTPEWETPRHIPAQGQPEGQRAATGMGCKPVSPAHFYYYQQVFTVVNTSDGRRGGSNMITGEAKGGRCGAASSPASPNQLLHFRGDVRWLTLF